jgi:hypothetical protein
MLRRFFGALYGLLGLSTVYSYLYFTVSRGQDDPWPPLWLRRMQWSDFASAPPFLHAIALIGLFMTIAGVRIASSSGPDEDDEARERSTGAPHPG